MKPLRGTSTFTAIAGGGPIRRIRCFWLPLLKRDVFMFREQRRDFPRSPHSAVLSSTTLGAFPSLQHTTGCYRRCRPQSGCAHLFPPRTPSLAKWFWSDSHSTVNIPNQLYRTLSIPSALPADGFTVCLAIRSLGALPKLRRDMYVPRAEGIPGPDVRLWTRITMPADPAVPYRGLA